MSIWGSHYLRADGEPLPGRRQALLRISPEVVLGLLFNLNREDHRVTISGLPVDARVIMSGYDLQMDTFVLRLESEEFEPVPDGAMFPYLNPSLTEHFPQPVAEESV